jgi:hypothetical protein
MLAGDVFYMSVLATCFMAAQATIRRTRLVAEENVSRT